VFSAYAQLLSLRKGQLAFHPNAAQTIYDLNPRLFCVLRSQTGAANAVLCIINVSPDRIQQRVSKSVHGQEGALLWKDLIGGESYLAPDGDLELVVEKYQSLWLVAE
jgi:sucrose phosphorylase